MLRVSDMFAHQVIDEIKDIPVLIKNNILNSQKFHISDVKNIRDLNNKHIGTTPAFVGNDLKFPYRHCWFDWMHTTGKAKFAALIEYSYKTNTFTCIHFGCVKETGWLVDPVFNLIEICEHIPLTGNVKSAKLYDDDKQHLSPDEYTQRWLGDPISFLHMIVTLLNCKNIGTEIVPAPLKLNKKRKKVGKQPIFSYRTLVIKPVGKKQESIPKHLWNNRIHLTRGHFKTYTEEKPLFGRITGRFWWQPAVRGRNRDGVVMKDYKVVLEGGK